MNLSNEFSLTILWALGIFPSLALRNRTRVSCGYPWCRFWKWTASSIISLLCTYKDHIDIYLYSNIDHTHTLYQTIRQIQIICFVNTHNFLEPIHLLGLEISDLIKVRLETCSCWWNWLSKITHSTSEHHIT